MWSLGSGVVNWDQILINTFKTCWSQILPNECKWHVFCESHRLWILLGFSFQIFTPTATQGYHLDVCHVADIIVVPVRTCIRSRSVSEIEPLRPATDFWILVVTLRWKQPSTRWRLVTYSNDAKAMTFIVEDTWPNDMLFGSFCDLLALNFMAWSFIDACRQSSSISTNIHAKMHHARSPKNGTTTWLSTVKHYYTNTHTHTHFCIFQSSRGLQYPPLFINHWVDACFLFAFKGVKQENSPNANDSTRKTVRFGASEVISVFVVKQRLHCSSSAPKGVHLPHMRTLDWELCRSLANVTYFLSFFIPLPCLASLPVLGMRLPERTFRLESAHHSPEPWVCSFLGLSWKALYS